VSIDEALVATIGVHTISVSGIGTVHAVSCWIDDEDGTTHTFILPPNVLHFPKSTVNLIIVYNYTLLTDNARTAKRLWPEAAIDHQILLWPFALKYAQHIHNY
jgi:hypothetical protein